MIDEQRPSDPIPLLRSAVIPPRFQHGFTSRRGGVSRPPYEGLNLGMRWGDARESVVENRRRLLAAAGAAPLYVATQVHGAAVVRVRRGDDAGDVARAEADGLCTGDPDVAVSVYVADCVPVLIADARTGAAAAVHAGWRGTVAGVVPAAVRRMAADFGSRPEDLRVAMGPAIGACCFEVGDEVVQAVERALPGARAAGAVRAEPGWGKPHVDLKRINALLLAAEGVPASAVDAGPECTSCEPARFYSYRRDHGQTGQHAAFIRFAPEP